MTLEVRFKVVVNNTGPSSKRLAITPKALEIASLKVMSGDKEIEMEQMLILGVVNIQLEALKDKYFKEFSYELKNLNKKIPGKVKCFGFNLADFDVSFKKNQVQISLYKENASKPMSQCKSLFTKLNAQKFLKPVNMYTNEKVDKLVR